MIIMNQGEGPPVVLEPGAGRLPCTLGQKSKDSQGLVLSHHLPLSLHISVTRARCGQRAEF
jgi:hypothetical protein